MIFNVSGLERTVMEEGLEKKKKRQEWKQTQDIKDTLVIKVHKASELARNQESFLKGHDGSNVL